MITITKGIAVAAAAITIATPVFMACDGIRRQDQPLQGGMLTFTKDVAPIVFGHCVPCHHPDGPAPFSLASYTDVRQRLRTVVDVVERRYMPPWLPAPGHGEFSGARRLDDDQIAALRRWQQQGAVEGSHEDLPSTPTFRNGWQLGEPDLIVSLPAPYTLAPGGGDVWRNFVMPIPLDTGAYVETVEIRPGSGRFVHHALLGVDATNASDRRDRRDPGVGFGGMDMGDALAPDGHLLGWTPGISAFPGIKGKAWRVDPGTDFVLQLHLLASGKPEQIQPLIGVHFAEGPPSAPPMSLIRLDADHLLDIPPGEKRFVVSDSLVLPVDVDVLAVYPHAHYLATTIEARARRPDGSEEALIRIDNWDFRWQDVYRYTRAVFLPRGSTITMRISYDNSSDNPRNPSHPPRRVVAGLASSDEMAHLQLQVLPKRSEDTALLKEALYRSAILKNANDPWASYELGNALRDQGRLAEAIQHYRAALARDPQHATAHNNLGVVLAQQGQVEQAIDHYRSALRAEADLADAQYNLGNALRSIGRSAEAAAHFREALRLEPEFPQAYNNLGEILASQGRLDEAVAAFRRAVDIDPESAEGHNNLGAALGRRGELEEAIRHWSIALQIAPGHAAARENLRLATEAPR